MSGKDALIVKMEAQRGVGAWQVRKGDKVVVALPTSLNPDDANCEIYGEGGPLGWGGASAKSIRRAGGQVCFGISPESIPDGIFENFWPNAQD